VPIQWGAADPVVRGPVIATVTNTAQRNAIGTHSGSYSVYRAVAVAAGLSKTFIVAERLRLRLESTFTNLPNHPNFAPPAVVVSSPVSFGRTTAVQTQENSGNRTGQVALRLDF